MKIDFELLCEEVSRIIDEEELYEQQNTLAADVNEIFLGYYALGGTWSGFQNAKEAQEALNVRKAQIDPDVYRDQEGRAKVMAEESLRWAVANGYNGKVNKVWWTARPGILAKAVGYEVDSRKNPTDTLLGFSDGGFLGLSAKSAKSKGDIGFKNPGLGSLSRAIGTDLAKAIVSIEQDAITKYNLPVSKKERKAFIRTNPEVREKTVQIGMQVLNTLRDELFEHYKNNFTNETIKEHALDVWLDAKEVLPKYIKVTGKGKDGNYSASVHDPIKNEKLTALSSERVTITKVGNDSIGFSAGAFRLFKARFKYESEKLASSIKLSGDPWT